MKRLGVASGGYIHAHMYCFTMALASRLRRNEDSPDWAKGTGKDKTLKQKAAVAKLAGATLPKAPKADKSGSLAGWD